MNARIRLWLKWLADEKLVPRVRKLGLELHLGTGIGTRAEVLPLLAHGSSRCRVTIRPSW